MTPRSITTVLVTYNRLHMLKKTLEHVLAQDFEHVIVVDNASTDGTKAWLQTLDDPRLCILHETVNHGGAGGFATGIEYAAKKPGLVPLKHHWIVCFDDDSWPERKALAIFQNLSLPEDIGAVAAAVYFPDGRICPMNRPGRNPLRSLKVFLNHLSQKKFSFGIPDSAYQTDHYSEVDYSSFVGLFIRADLIHQTIGLPDKNLFIYGDDIIYTWNIRKKGYRILFIPNITFQHDCHRTTNNDYHEWRCYYIIRNQTIFYKIFLGFFFATIFPVLLLRFVKIIFSSKKSSKYYYAGFLALTDGLRNKRSRSHHEILELFRKN